MPPAVPAAAPSPAWIAADAFSSLLAARCLRSRSGGTGAIPVEESVVTDASGKRQSVEAGRFLLRLNIQDGGFHRCQRRAAAGDGN
jgi:hypothetical protein